MKTGHMAPRLKVAIIGQGCAGLASAHHLLRIHHKNDQNVQIDMFDAFGIGAGATGVAAGLLHPFGVSGKLLWQGLPAYAAAAELVQESQLVSRETFSRSMGLFRPAKNDKQRRQFAKNIGWTPSDQLLHAVCVSSPGTSDLISEDTIAGFYIPNGLVIDTKKYLDAVWNLCLSQTRESGSVISMYQKTITSLEELEEHGYDAIIVATGAAIEEIKELKGVVNLDLCQGYTVDISKDSAPERTPMPKHSILGNPYIAFQGSTRAIIGATQKHGVSSSEAFRICETGQNDVSEEASQAAANLLHDAQACMADLHDWHVTSVRSGVRGLPTRTSQGSIPYAGRVNDKCWILAGLGARGLVYHAWLAMMTASSIFHDNDIISVQYPELTRWKHHHT